MTFIVWSYLQFRDFLNPDIISNSSHNNSSQVFMAWKLHLTNLEAKKKKKELTFTEKKKEVVQKLQK